MSLKLMYITNNEQIAKIAESNGVDWIFIDLEINGKEERQGHLDTVISRHNIEDVKRVKDVLINTELLVRINPIYDGSLHEIEQVVKDGADIVMLPYFKSKEEVETFIGYVNGRAKTCLLLETPEAVENIDSILALDGINYIHIGLNDLHLGYNKKFMFELLTDGTVEGLCHKFKKKGITYGFGGIAQIGQGSLPAENIIAEHYRLGSNMVILSRGFCNQDIIDDLNQVGVIFKSGIKEIRKFESALKEETEAYFLKNRNFVYGKVTNIVNQRNLAIIQN
jgi:2-keto-3-deoxy-L-rhamnonate aldolase RhmA